MEKYVYGASIYKEYLVLDLLQFFPLAADCFALLFSVPCKKHSVPRFAHILSGGLGLYGERAGFSYVLPLFVIYFFM